MVKSMIKDTMLQMAIDNLSVEEFVNSVKANSEAFKHLKGTNVGQFLTRAVLSLEVAGHNKTFNELNISLQISMAIVSIIVRKYMFAIDQVDNLSNFLTKINKNYKSTIDDAITALLLAQ